MSVRNHVCSYIDEWLNNNNVSGSALAKAMGVSDASVKRWRSGVCSPDIDLFPKLCEFMRISVNELLGMDARDLSARDLEISNRYDNDPKFRDLIDVYTINDDLRKSFDYLIDVIKNR